MSNLIQTNWDLVTPPPHIGLTMSGNHLSVLEQQSAVPWNSMGNVLQDLLGIQQAPVSFKHHQGLPKTTELPQVSSATCFMLISCVLFSSAMSSDMPCHWLFLPGLDFLASIYEAGGWSFGISWWLSVKESVYNAGDMGSIPALGRSPGEGNDNPLQYSCLGDLMNWGA